MRTANISLQEIFNEMIPQEKREETRISFAISNRLDALMQEKGLNKKTVCRSSRKTAQRDNTLVEWRA